MLKQSQCRTYQCSKPLKLNNNNSHWFQDTTSSSNKFLVTKWWGVCTLVRWIRCTGQGTVQTWTQWWWTKALETLWWCLSTSSSKWTYNRCKCSKCSNSRTCSKCLKCKSTPSRLTTLSRQAKPPTSLQAKHKPLLNRLQTSNSGESIFINIHN